MSAKIVSRWTERFRAEGREGMQDRSSRPKLIPTQTAEPLAGRIKDLAAGGVLAAAIGALAVGVIIFGPKLWALLPR